MTERRFRVDIARAIRLDFGHAPACHFDGSRELGDVRVLTAKELTDFAATRRLLAKAGAPVLVVCARITDIVAVALAENVKAKQLNVAVVGAPLADVVEVAAMTGASVIEDIAAARLEHLGHARGCRVDGTTCIVNAHPHDLIMTSKQPDEIKSLLQGTT